MMHTNYIVFFLLIMLFGCSTQPNVTPNRTNTKTAISQHQSTLPNWILTPGKPNQLCSVGSSTNSSDAPKKALLQVKADIAKEIELYLHHESNSESRCNTQACTQAFKSFTKTQTATMLQGIQITDRYIDNAHDIYYLRACTPKTETTFTYSPVKTPLHQYMVTKKACLLQSNFPDKTLNEQKAILIKQAKQSALNELYGELLYAQTNLIDGKLSHEAIQQTALGTVRTAGNPIFYQGTNLGEICADVTAYVTEGDRQKYAPKKVTLKQFCFTDGTVAVDSIKDEAILSAYQAMIAQFKPSLHLTKTQAQRYIHGFTLTDEAFDFTTRAYCFNATGTLFPYELELPLPTLAQPTPGTENGLLVTFYDQYDSNMVKPLFNTTVDTLKLDYKKLPFNAHIKKDTPYLITIEGFVKSPKRVTQPLKLLSNVYSANFYLNNTNILNLEHTKHLATLHAGYNAIRLVLKTANRYDIRIDGELSNFYTNTTPKENK